MEEEYGIYANGRLVCIKGFEVTAKSEPDGYPLALRECSEPAPLPIIVEFMERATANMPGATWRKLEPGDSRTLGE